MGALVAPCCGTVYNINVNDKSLNENLCFPFQNESRGLKDPEGVKRKKQKKEAAEKDALRAGNQGESGLKVLIWPSLL